MKTCHFTALQSLTRIMRKTTLLFIMIALMPLNAFAETKPVIGWLEHVMVNDAKLQFDAKIDTGADTTSLGAKVIKKYEVDGQEWIRFRVTNNNDETIVLNKPVLRYVSIKRRLMTPIERPVVNLGICLGNIYREIEVNLASRKNFKYRMLIGRDFLRGTYVVDSEIDHSISPSCAK